MQKGLERVGLLIKKEKGQGVWAILPFFYLPSLSNRGGVEGAPAASGHDGAREEGEKGEESERVRLHHLLRPETACGGVTTVAGGGGRGGCAARFGGGRG